MDAHRDPSMKSPILNRFLENNVTREKPDKYYAS